MRVSKCAQIWMDLGSHAGLLWRYFKQSLTFNIQVHRRRRERHCWRPLMSSNEWVSTRWTGGTRYSWREQMDTRNKGNQSKQQHRKWGKENWISFVVRVNDLVTIRASTGHFKVEWEADTSPVGPAPSLLSGDTPSLLIRSKFSFLIHLGLDRWSWTLPYLFW